MRQHENEEDLLRTIPLRRPSVSLDERMEKLLATERAELPRVGMRAMPAWQFAAACVACAAGAFLAGILIHGKRDAGAPKNEVRYVIQVDRKDFDVFDWTTYPKNRAPLSILKAKQALKNGEET